MKFKNFYAKASAFFALSFVTAVNSYAQWDQKFKTTMDSGVTSINGLVETILKFLMAISAMIFIVGIGNAAFKYWSGDREAFKSISALFYGMLVIFIGTTLVKILFF